MGRESRWAIGVLCAVLGACDDSSAGSDGADSGGSGGDHAAASGGSGGAHTTTPDVGADAGRAGTGGANGAGGSGGTGSALDAGADAGSEPGDSGAGPASGDPDATWSPLTLISIVNPIDHGAIGDGTADDLSALAASVDALPAAGGIVYLPQGKSFRKTNLLTITRAHVKLWSPNRQAEIFAAVLGQRRHQSILCQAEWCGFFGLSLRSDASERFDALEDNQISIDHTSDAEISGVEIDGSAAVGIMLYGSTRSYVDGNYIHHTWADHIHHTDGARQSWCWDNFIFNQEPSRGDDGIACVTYGENSTQCGEMEWWNNTILHTDWGRGYSVIGGDDIRIHDNWAIEVAGAGVIIASEPSYMTAGSSQIEVRNNHVYRCGHAIGHPGLLVSGANEDASPLRALSFIDNQSVETENGQAYRAEGNYDDATVTNQGLSESAADLPSPIPTLDDVVLRDTSVLRTLDTSFVPEPQRGGLYRIHVRPAANADGFEQRFEYIVAGAGADVSAFAAARSAAGDYVSAQHAAGDKTYVLVLTAQPVSIPAALQGVSFTDLRAGAGAALAWLWQLVNTAAY